MCNNLRRRTSRNRPGQYTRQTRTTSKLRHCDRARGFEASVRGTGVCWSLGRESVERRVAGHAEDSLHSWPSRGQKRAELGLTYEARVGSRPGVYDHHERHGWYWGWEGIFGGVLGYYLDGGLAVYLASGAMEEGDTAFSVDFSGLEMALGFASEDVDIQNWREGWPCMCV
jgi:hypothetical protein